MDDRQEPAFLGSWNLQFQLFFRRKKSHPSNLDMENHLKTIWTTHFLVERSNKMNKNQTQQAVGWLEGYPQIIHISRVFHHKPSILGCP